MILRNLSRALVSLPQAYRRQTAPQWKADVRRSARFGWTMAGQWRTVLAERNACSRLDGSVAFARRHVGSSTQIFEELLGFTDYARESAPGNYVEIGTAYGGTNFAVSAALPSLVRSVAVDSFVRRRVPLACLARPGLELFAVDGDSSARDTVERVRRALGGEDIDLLLIDGDHSFRGVLADFMTYRKMVAPGGLIAFHDIVPDAKLRGLPETHEYGGEVPIVWQSLKAQFDSREFVDSWDQYGRGIGVLRNDPTVTPTLPTVAELDARIAGFRNSMR